MRTENIIGKKEKTEDISRCFDCFKQFREDFPILLEKGVIKRIAFNHYKWVKSEVSLAEYFKWIGRTHTIGGFWETVEETFMVKRETLSKTYSRYHNSQYQEKSKESKDFLEIKKIVLQYREEIKKQEEQEKKDRKKFTAIKTLINKTNDRDIKEIGAALINIKTILIGNSSVM